MDVPGRNLDAVEPASTWKRSYRRAWMLTTAIAVTLLAVSAIVFAVSSGTRRITAHAEAMHLADEALRTATVARAQIGFANHLAAVQREFGTDVTAAREDAARTARTALDYLTIGARDLVATGAGADSELETVVGDFVDEGNRTLTLIDSGASEAADAIVRDNLETAYESMFAELEAVRDEQFGEVQASDVFLARLGDFARFLVAFLIPVAVIIVFREIVRRQQRQAELEIRLKAEKDIGAARDDFIANASHEFRTPLTSIYGLSQLIEEDPATPEPTRDYAGIISGEAADLTRMVEDLLTTARLESGALTFQPEDVVTDDELADVIRPFNRSGAAIEVDVAPAIVRVDRLRQRQVLRNLISNARKYGGPQVQVIGMKQGRWYDWIVRDDGNGVPEELELKLFQRFVHRGTTVVVPGGVGLGLSIVRALTEGMGGSAEYRRVEGWTEFVIRVPLVETIGRSGRHAGGVHAEGGLQVAASTPLDRPEAGGG